jgi:DNA-binding FadR family transcriptional regulator
MGEIMSMVAGRVPVESIAEVRAAAHDAWARRKANPEFVNADLDVLRHLVGTTNFLPGLWMLNQMSGIYNDLAKSMGTVLAPSDGYVAAWDGVLDALEQGDSDASLTRLNQYLAATDERLLALLELLQ